MVDDLSQFRGQAQIAVHFLVEKRSDTCGSQAKRLRSKIHSLTKSSGLEMHVSISTIAVNLGSLLEIADHRERYASFTCEVLSQAERSRYQTLVPFLDFLQLRVFWPIAINTRW